MDENKNTVTLWVALSGARLATVAEGGSTLGEIAGYDPEMVYIAEGRVLSAEDIVLPGTQISVAPKHTNGS